MAQAVCTVTRYNVGLTVYGNEGCQLSPRRSGHLRLVACNPAEEEESPAAYADDRACGTKAVYPVSASAYLHDPTLEPEATNFCFWLEDRYAESQVTEYGWQEAPIKVRDMPPQPVVDMAVAMLRQRGWVVNAPTRREVSMSGPRSGVISMKQVSF